jgi:hypothetical protein
VVQQLVGQCVKSIAVRRRKLPNALVIAADDLPAERLALLLSEFSGRMVYRESDVARFVSGLGEGQLDAFLQAEF